MNTASRLNNRYEILHEIGDGGFGKTFLVRDHQMPSARECVVKQLKPLHDKAEVYEMVKDRFQREAAILEKLGAHNQIPSLYAYFSETDLFYLVEEYVEGETLTQRIDRTGVLSEDEVRSLLKQLLPVIVHIHQQQIVHRDIKPDNIILRESDQKPVVIDFGAVKETMSTMLNTQGKSTHSIVVGTPGYMPSEQLAGRPMYSSDLYSLGLTAIYLLTGKMPSEIDTSPETGAFRWRGHIAGISEAFAEFLDRAIQVNPHARFRNAQEMYLALNSLDVGPMTLPPESAAAQQPHLAMPAASATVVSMPPATVTSTPTQVMSPANPSVGPATPSGYYPTTASAGGEWKKAAMTGGIIGMSILIGAVVLKGPSNPFAAVSPKPTATASPAANVTQPSKASSAKNPDTGAKSGDNQSATPPVQTKTIIVEKTTPAVTAAEARRRNAGTNATIVGKAGSKNIRSGPGTQYAKKHVAYPGDRVTILADSRDSGGYTWRKIHFPQSGAEGWIASQLLQADGGNNPPMETAPPRKVVSKPAPPVRQVATNASIGGKAGSKNIRSGPGTQYGKKHVAYPGDRVKIVGSGQDRGGYTWHKVYFPKSGAEGWIAAQLLNID
ncbi:protein kinase [filamentous cyanobacterium LEGE 11480]|uniref:non-specific serine/threonine protein kinase n=1 Tax=Romeriopsis navalis LEGE 11480 TaxID=2777977 RepID=A0A928VPE9_9CYAN|nr:protein kinase [Romeriopsis navalis]MBE9032055.1 protein kinase [Romeriopsis navalis LEGE 11480]